MNKSVENEQKTELIVVKQLPVIEDQLLKVKASIQERVDTVRSLVCNEDNYKEIKKVRSDLNKEYAALEKRRKEIKTEILKPYQQFEEVYKECAGDLYMSADKELAQKINEVETGLKQQKIDDLEKYFAEYRESIGIPAEFVAIEAAGIKVGLSDSKVSLHRQAAEFLDRISADLKVIDTLEYGDEVLAEYRGKYNLSTAMLTVDNRHKMIEAERARREEQKAKQEAAQISAAEVIKAVEEIPEAVQAPVKVPVAEEVAEKPAAEPMLQVSFVITGTLDQLKALKAFLIEGGYKYEQF